MLRKKSIGHQREWSPMYKTCDSTTTDHRTHPIHQQPQNIHGSEGGASFPIPSQNDCILEDTSPLPT